MIYWQQEVGLRDFIELIAAQEARLTVTEQALPASDYMKRNDNVIFVAGRAVPLTQIARSNQDEA